MFVATHLGRFGQFGQLGQFGQFTTTPDEDAAFSGLSATVSALSVQEAQLRASFAAVLPDLDLLQATNQNVPPDLLAIMQRYNTAAATTTEAAKVWIQARNQAPSSDLPDPNAQAVAIPTFDIPTSGFGRFGAAAGVPARSIRIRHGIVGQEVSTGLGDFFMLGYTGREGLGEPISLGVAICVLLGLIIVGTFVILALRAMKTSDTVAVNQALSEQSKNRAEEVKSDRDLYVSTRDTCIGTSTDAQVRVKCIQQAAEVLKFAKEGRPPITPGIIPSTTSILATVGVIALVGLVAGGGYLIYRRGKQSGSALPRASSMRHRHGSRSAYDDDELDY